MVKGARPSLEWHIHIPNPSPVRESFRGIVQDDLITLCYVNLDQSMAFSPSVGCSFTKWWYDVAGGGGHEAEGKTHRLVRHLLAKDVDCISLNRLLQ